MKLSPKQMELLNKLNNKWVDVMNFEKLNLNTVHSLYNKGYIDIKWIGTDPNRKMMIRKKNND